MPVRAHHDKEFLSAMRRRLMDLSRKLALIDTDDPERLKHSRERYEEQLHECRRLMPEWVDWFLYGNEPSDQAKRELGWDVEE